MLILSLFAFLLNFQLQVNTKAVLPDAGLHEPFDVLLQKYVDERGKVDYDGFKSSESILDTYLEKLSVKQPNPFASESEKLVYWINLYNASTIKLIVEHYPIKSILDIDNGKPWDRKWILVAGRKYSLNEIENDIIRPQFNEPRIHFALNCAALSCPPLMNKAWNSFSLELDLEKRTKAFINAKTYNTINKSSIIISKIFEWYKSDFGNILRYINKYSNQPVVDNAKVTFDPYDWQLNKQ